MDFEVIISSEGTYIAACYMAKIFIEAESLKELNDGIMTALDERFTAAEQKPAAADINLIFYQE